MLRKLIFFEIIILFLLTIFIIPVYSFECVSINRINGNDKSFVCEVIPVMINDSYGNNDHLRNNLDTNDILFPNALDFYMSQNNILINIFSNKNKNLNLFKIYNNNPPDTPTIIGPRFGKIKESYTYIITTKDPEEDDVKYYIDWGDGTFLITNNYYQSGEILKIKYIYPDRGNYIIRVQAQDVYGALSDWGMLEITMSKEKLFMYEFIEKFHILGFLGNYI